MFSTVITVYNEADSLLELHEQLDAVAREQDYDLEIVFVDDGSTDSSWEIIQQLARDDQRIRGIRFRRNFGKAAAQSAGFAAASGDPVFTLDADLQDDPKEIPRFLSEMDQGYDVVSGWKRERHDPWHKVIPSRVFNWLVSRMTGVQLHDHNCGFKCYRREIFQEVRLYGELHRFIPVLAAARGWRVAEVVVAHRARKHGHSKYGVGRIPKGFLDLMTVKFLTGFGQRPQHLLGTIGLVAFAVGAVGGTWLSVYWGVSRIVPSLEPIHLHQRAIFYYSLGAALLGSQFVAIGFLAELITAWHGQEQAPYSIAQRVGPGEEGDPASDGSPMAPSNRAGIQAEGSGPGDSGAVSP
jgi:dolichol-phosphate mannosyltransferase